MKGIIFDYDGTLVDSLPQIREVLNETLAHYCLRPVTLEDTGKFIGDGSLKLVERAINKSVAFTNSEIAQVHAYYIERYNQASNASVLPYDGIAEMLQGLINNNVKIAVVSNKPQLNVESGIADVFPSIKFDFIIGGANAQNLPLKPNPAMVNYAIEQLGLRKSEVAYIGDAEADVVVAKNAEVKGYAVLWGYRTAEQLATAGARCFLDLPKKILGLTF